MQEQQQKQKILELENRIVLNFPTKPPELPRELPKIVGPTRALIQAKPKIFAPETKQITPEEAHQRRVKKAYTLFGLENPENTKPDEADQDGIEKIKSYTNAIDEFNKQRERLDKLATDAKIAENKHLPKLLKLQKNCANLLDQVLDKVNNSETKEQDRQIAIKILSAATKALQGDPKELKNLARALSDHDPHWYPVAGILASISTDATLLMALGILNPSIAMIVATSLIAAVAIGLFARSLVPDKPVVDSMEKIADSAGAIAKAVPSAK